MMKKGKEEISQSKKYDEFLIKEALKVKFRFFFIKKQEVFILVV